MSDQDPQTEKGCLTSCFYIWKQKSSSEPSATMTLECEDQLMCSFTKPPLFQRNRLTGSGNPTFESYVEGKALYREIEVYSRSSFQIPHDCTHFIEAQLIRTGLVLWSPKRGSQCTQNFPALGISLYTTFKRGIAFAY